MNQLRLLMMSPDEAARNTAVSALLQAGISARGCSTSLELFGLLSNGTYDAVVLNVGTLGEIGYALVPRLHGSSSLGSVVMGNDLSLATRLRCLQSGADACPPPPHDPRELACILLALAGRLLVQVVGHQETGAVRAQVEAQPVALAQIAIEPRVQTEGARAVGEILERRRIELPAPPGTPPGSRGRSRRPRPPAGSRPGPSGRGRPA